MISQGPEAETRLDQALDAPMVLLNDVVEVLDLAQPCEAPQLTVSLHRPDCGRENAQAGAEALLGVGGRSARRPRSGVRASLSPLVLRHAFPSGEAEPVAVERRLNAV